ncbi:MAG TPA: ATP-binding protein [Longimicrobiales bacterium]|nr:ATP-binding protein [Longimicrobiales bacterium]
MDNALNANALDLERELDWFETVLDARLKSYFQPTDEIHPADMAPPVLARSDYARFVRQHELTREERLVLILSLIPHIRPQLLDVFWARNDATERGFTEFGGWHSAQHGGFLPTGETAAFLIAGDDLAGRFEVSRYFEGDHLFARHNVLRLASAAATEPHLSGALCLSDEYRYRFTTGAERKPNFNSDFPARLIETELAWSDLVLPDATLDQLDEIRDWLQHGPTLLGAWGMQHKLRPGFTSLFHGPPGTGKTLSACLLGRHCGCDVYKIDLSMVVSKYIGETEKNLAKVFDLAEHRRWILFFDEADALFGRRTRVESSHDRYANQEISFLLQRIEEFNGVVILASNLKSNVDDAFLRRFQSVVHFPMPRPAERKRIWQNAFSPRAVLEDGIDLGRLAEKHELSGGTIMNVVRYSSLKALSRNQSVIWLADMEEGIRREFLKEGRTS